MSTSARRRPTIRRVRDWAPGTTLPPAATPEARRLAQATLDDASDLLPTTVARADLVALEKMVKTESGFRELFMPPLPSNVETMEIVDVELEVVPKKSDVRELTARAPRDPAPSSATALASLVDAYEARAERAAASPKTEEIDLDAMEEIEVAKRSAPPPLPRPLPPRAPMTAIATASARAYAARIVPLARPHAIKLQQLAARWPELYDLDTKTKVGVIALWMALWVNLTLLFAR